MEENALIPYESSRRRCQATSTRTFVRCENWSTSGARFCRLHQTTQASRLPFLLSSKRAPVKHGGYMRHLSRVGQQVYQETLGDISPLEELAMVRAVLAEILERRRETQDLEDFLLSVPQGSTLGQNADGTLSPVSSDEEMASERIRKNRKTTMEDMDVIVAAERVVHVATQAYGMLQGRRVLLTFDDKRVEDEVRKAIDEFTKNFFPFLNNFLCPACRAKLGDELLSQRRTEVVAE